MSDKKKIAVRKCLPLPEGMFSSTRSPKAEIDKFSGIKSQLAYSLYTEFGILDGWAIQHYHNYVKAFSKI